MGVVHTPLMFVVEVVLQGRWKLVKIKSLDHLITGVMVVTLMVDDDSMLPAGATEVARQSATPAGQRGQRPCARGCTG